MSTAETTPPAVTQREILELLRVFGASDWRSITVQVGELRLTVDKDGAPAERAEPATAPARPAPVPVPKAAAAAPPSVPTPIAVAADLVAVRSPAVGAFWVAPSPGSPPFVTVGQTVAADDQLAIVEVMKLMNPVAAPVAGEIVQVCAANSDLVEYDQVLFLLRPADGA
jgi:acetyl-CoA carboxylase biotin carboxyl carrier protein